MEAVGPWMKEAAWGEIAGQNMEELHKSWDYPTYECTPPEIRECRIIWKVQVWAL